MMIRASSWGDILQVGEWGCRRRAYYRRVKAPKAEVYNPDINRGVDLEVHALKKFLGITKLKLVPRSKQKEIKKEINGVLYTGHVDAMVQDGDNRAVVEVKCPQPQTFQKYRSEIPDGYLYQIQQYLMILDLQRAYFVAYNGMSAELLYHEILRDENVWKDMQERAKEFLALAEPPERRFAVGAEQCKRCEFYQHCWEGMSLLLQKDEKRDITNNTEMVALATKYIEFEETTKLISKRLDEIKEQIKKYMIENGITGIKWDGGGEIILREEERENFETKRFKEENPDIAKNYVKVIKVYKLITKGGKYE